jgi:hypothetical protein
MASASWFASSMWTVRIRFIDNFTVSMDTKYIDPGNIEVGSWFLSFAVIMSFWCVLLALDYLFTYIERNKNRSKNV